MLEFIMTILLFSRCLGLQGYSDWELSTSDPEYVLVARKLNWDSYNLIATNSSAAERTDYNHDKGTLLKESITVISKNSCNIEKIRGVFAMFNKREPHNFIIIQPMDCIRIYLNQINQIDRHLGQQGYFDHYSKWIFVLPDGIKPGMFSRHVGNITNIIMMAGSNISHKALLWTGVKLSRDKSEFRLVGSISGQTLSNHSDLLPNLKYGFNLRHFHITTIEWGHYTKVHTIANSTYLSGYCIDLIDEMARVSNFSYTIALVPDGNWGGLKNNTWNGMIGQLYRKEADMAVASITFSYIRSTAVDFVIMPLIENRLVGMYAHAGSTKLNNHFIKPYKTQVWLCILLMLILVIIAGHTLQLFNSGKNYQKLSKADICSGLSLTALLVLGAELRQGMTLKKTALSENFLWGSLWLFVVIICATYEGNLVASLAVTQEKVPFETVEDLLANTEYKFGTMGSSNNEDIFKYSISKQYREMYSRMLEKSTEDPDVLHSKKSVHLEKVKSEKFLTVVDEISYELEKLNDCNIRKMKHIFNQYIAGMAVQKHSAFKDKLDDLMVQVWSSGIRDYMWKKNWPSSQPCTTNAERTISVTLAGVYSVFQLLGALLLIAVLVLLSEIIFTYLNIKLNVVRHEN